MGAKPRLDSHGDDAPLRSFFLDDIETAEFAALADEPMVLVVGNIADHADALLPEERGMWDRFSGHRRKDFASGRRVAHEALRVLTGSVQPVTMRDRQPHWPSQCVGSISHSRELTVALVGDDRAWRGVGVDLAPCNSVPENVGRRVMVDAEITWSTQRPGDWRTVVFSAKEAIYKAVNPIVGEFLGFRDVTLEVDSTGTTFTAMTVVERASTKWVRAGRGFIEQVRGHWMTFFLIDGDYEG